MEAPKIIKPKLKREMNLYLFIICFGEKNSWEYVKQSLIHFVGDHPLRSIASVKCVVAKKVESYLLSVGVRQLVLMKWHLFFPF